MKVLLISHNPFTTKNNMGKTFLSLFSCFEKGELAQLYIYPSWPDRDAAASYYRVTDKDMLRRFTKLCSPGGVVPAEKVDTEQGIYEEAADQSFYKDRRNKSPLRRLLRDALWKVGGWDTPALENWLEEQRPTCIFVAVGGAKFLYDIALTIAKKRSIPIVTYMCDDYYFATPTGALDRLRLGLLKRKTEKLLKKSSCLTVISPEMEHAYAEHFGVKTVTVMTGASFAPAAAPRERGTPRNLCYFGNLGCGRYVSLGQIGQALDRLNEKNGTEYRLLIYTAEQNEEILSSLRKWQSVELRGFVSGAEYREAFESTDILLHTEAFDAKSREFVRCSLSTKIADSLASGVPLFAYGPAEVASMAHLLRHDCAVTAVCREELEEKLEAVFSHEALRRSTVEKALKTVAACHDSNALSRELHRLLETCGKETDK